MDFIRHLLYAAVTERIAFGPWHHGWDLCFRLRVCVFDCTFDIVQFVHWSSLHSLSFGQVEISESAVRDLKIFDKKLGLSNAKEVVLSDSAQKSCTGSFCIQIVF